MELYTIIAQFINFGVLIFLLNKFLYKPVLKTMEKRREDIKNKIEETEKKLEESEKLKEEYFKKLQEVEKETYTTSGVISFLSQVAVDGTTYYCIQLEGDSNLYMSSIKLNPMQVLMTVSSTVNIEYQETETEAVYLVTNIEL